MIEWPPDVQLPQPRQVYEEAMRVHGRSRQALNVSKAVTAIYLAEVVGENRLGRKGVWLGAVEQTGISSNSWQMLYAKNRKKPEIRRLAFNLLNELIRLNR